MSPPPELRQNLYTLIDKLSDRSTLSQALTQLHSITRSLPSQSLPTFLSCILSFDSSSSKPYVRVHCLNLLSLLSQTHSHSLSSHLSKPIIPSLLRRLRDPHSAVRSAVVSAVSSLSPIGFSSLLGPLLGSVLTEQDGNARIGACLSLKAAVESVGFVGVVEEGELRKAVPKLVKMVKGSVGVKGKGKGKEGLLGLIGSVVKVNGGGVVKGRSGLVESVVGCGVDMLWAEDWGSRKAAAEVLEMVAVNVGGEFVREFKGFVVTNLESRRFDKVKITRETMNRALEAWKNVPGGPEDELILSTSNSSFSKENGCRESSSSRSRRSSFAGPKPKKTITKTRSSLSDDPIVSISSSNSTSTHNVTGLETSQRRKTMSKSGSSSSDESTITDSSLVSKSSYDGGCETPQPKKSTSRSRSSLPEDYDATVTKKNISSKGNSTKPRKPLDWKIDIAVSTPFIKVVAEDDMQSQCDTVEVSTSDSEVSSKFFEKTPEEVVLKDTHLRSGSCVVPFVEEEEPQGLVFEGEANEEASENNSDFEELSLIQNQLLQMERQQTSLLNLLQRFMGNSQNGICSLENRVSGLERALDDISYGLGVRSGRIPSNDSARSSCCPSAEFLNPKFWWRAEGRSSMSKSYSSVSGGANRDGNVEALRMNDRRFYDQKEGIWSMDSWRSFEINTTKSRKNIGQNS